VRKAMGSIMTLVIWGLMSVPLFYMEHSSNLWTLLLVPVFMAMHDTYSYWLHYWLHKTNFVHIHTEHHTSLNPTIVDTYNAHAAESVAWFLIVYLWVLIPAHPLAYIIAYGFAMCSVLIAHCDYRREFKIYGWIISAGGLLKANNAFRHHLHHRNSKINLGLFWTYWDGYMGTLR